jgi:hypothetical protein
VRLAKSTQEQPAEAQPNIERHKPLANLVNEFMHKIGVHEENQFGRTLNDSTLRRLSLRYLHHAYKRMLAATEIRKTRGVVIQKTRKRIQLRTLNESNWTEIPWQQWSLSFAKIGRNHGSKATSLLPFSLQIIRYEKCFEIQQ